MISKRLHPASFSNVNAQLAHIGNPDLGTLTNIMTNGDFSDGVTDWTSNFSSLSALSNVLSVTGLGNNPYPQFYQQTAIPSGGKIYVLFSARVTNTVCSEIVCVLSAEHSGYHPYTFQGTPTQNTWYQKSTVINTDADSGSLKLLIYHQYADAATANGKVLEAKNILVIDLTATYGAGNEPDASFMDELMEQYTNEWFDGAQTLTLTDYLLSQVRYLQAQITAYHP